MRSGTGSGEFDAHGGAVGAENNPREGANLSVTRQVTSKGDG
jgi:hypothetical protein